MIIIIIIIIFIEFLYLINYKLKLINESDYFLNLKLYNIELQIFITLQ